MMTRLAKTVVEPTAKNGFIFTLLGTKWGFLWLWLLIINVAAFLAYGLLSYGKVEDGYRYGVSTPAYLGWEGGYISVSLDQSYKIHLDEYGNEDGASGLSLGLYIWMKPFGENEYGVDILSPDIDKQIYITKDLEYVPYDPNDTKYNQQAEQILAEYKDQIQELMNRAQTMWPDVFD